MRRGRKTHEREHLNLRVRRDCQIRAHTKGQGGDGDEFRARGGRAVGAVEEVRRAEDLGVEVVGGAGARGAGAEAAARGEDGGVREEQGHAVVVARDGHGVHGAEGAGGRVPELGREGGVVVMEGFGVLHAAGDEDAAVGEDDAVVEGARVGHVGDGFGGDLGVGGVDGDDVGVGCGGCDVVDAGFVFVVGGSAYG